jgi:hypothetical protein
MHDDGSCKVRAENRTQIANALQLFCCERRPATLRGFRQESFDVSRNLGAQYGAMMAPRAANDELALGRVLENVVPKPH